MTHSSYPIREATDDPSDPSIEEVIDIALERAENPRTDHPQGHLDEDMKEIVSRYGEEAVEDCIRLHIKEFLPHRTSGMEAFSDKVAGIIVSTVATAYLYELRSEKAE